MVVDARELADGLTSLAPAASDPVRKYAQAPSLSTRQSSTPSDSWNWRGLMWSVIGAR
jgi:hypothetical protein